MSNFDGVMWLLTFFVGQLRLLHHLLVASVHKAFNFQRVVHDLPIAQSDTEHVRVQAVCHILYLKRVLLCDKQLLQY
jgi:hypothetical protein